MKFIVKAELKHLLFEHIKRLKKEPLILVTSKTSKSRICVLILRKVESKKGKYKADILVKYEMKDIEDIIDYLYINNRKLNKLMPTSNSIFDFDRFNFFLLNDTERREVLEEVMLNNL